MDRLEGFSIIGNGCAAVHAVKSLRENGFKGAINLFSDSIWPTYNPMLTSYYVAGKMDFENFFPFGCGSEFYKKHDVKLHLGSPVIKLDTEKQMVENDAGVVLNYDKCLIATGATPVLPPIPGIGSKNVFTLRTVEDAISIKRRLLKGAKKVLVIGASMAGIKAVEFLLYKNIECCLADLAPNVFSLAAHKNCSSILEDMLVEKGIKLKLGAGIQGLEDTIQGVRAFFSDGSTEDADFVIFCIGVRTNLHFLNREQVHIGRGVLVNKNMQTSVPNLYAAGDAAEGLDILTGKHCIIGLWANARIQGRTAGENMAGTRIVYHGNVLHNITHFMHTDFISIGSINEDGEVFEEYNKDSKQYCRMVWKAGRLLGVNLINHKEVSGLLKNSLIKGLRNENNLINEDKLRFSIQKLIENELAGCYPELKGYLERM